MFVVKSAILSDVNAYITQSAGTGARPLRVSFFVLSLVRQSAGTPAYGIAPPCLDVSMQRP